MTESESEAETLERLEVALRKIADLSRPPRRANAEIAGRADAEIDREALLQSLDMLITRLRTGLYPPHSAQHTE
jgi:hypothetical protein